MIAKNKTLEEIVDHITNLCDPVIINNIAISNVLNIRNTNMVIKICIETKGIDEILTLNIIDKKCGVIDEQRFYLNQMTFLNAATKNADIGKAIKGYINAFMEQ